jgi:hypothetical protein
MEQARFHWQTAMVHAHFHWQLEVLCSVFQGMGLGLKRHY